MALEFHARLSISIQHTSSFILEPNKCLSPVGVSAHKSATTSVCGGGVCVRTGWCGGGKALHTHLQRWKMTMSDRREGNEIFWCRWQCDYDRQTGQHVIPFPSVWAAHIWREAARLLSSFLLPSLLSTIQPQKQQQQQHYWRGWGGLFVTGKHLTSTS